MLIGIPNTIVPTKAETLQHPPKALASIILELGQCPYIA